VLLLPGSVVSTVNILLLSMTLPKLLTSHLLHFQWARTSLDSNTKSQHHKRTTSHVAEKGRSLGKVRDAYSQLLLAGGRL
jgi:hypothetical protein